MDIKFSEIKLNQLNFEDKYLSFRAVKSSSSKGRKINEPPCRIRTEFQRDRDRILHCKPFRRLKHKTQVFLSPLGDHYRTRMTHTLEVSQLSRTIARAMKLNEDLTEAIALGHDLGHTPFGHKGEKILNSLLSEGFRHNEQSCRVVDIIENLNLTKETLDGILHHTGEIDPYTMEGQIVKIADRIAYLNHDIDDAVRAKILSERDLPLNVLETLGHDTMTRITTAIEDIVHNSSDKVKMSQEKWEALLELRSWMFNNVYLNYPVKTEDYKVEQVLESLYNYYLQNFEIIQQKFKYEFDSKERIVADYIAGMTDRFAIYDYVEKFVPMSWGASASLSLKL